MDLLETAALPRHQLATRLLQEVKEPGPILLSGPSQSGKSHTLRELTETLQTTDIEHAFISCDQVDALENTRHTPTSHLLVIDSIERAPAELIEALADRVAAGGAHIASIGTDDEARNYHRVITKLADEDHPAAHALATSRNFRIVSLAQSDAARITEHTPGAAILDSATLAAVAKLSWGRPGWLLDLMRLAADGKIRTSPHASIAELDTSDLHLASFRFTLRAADEILDPASIAAAVVLSQLDPRTMQGASELVGAQSVAKLREAGLLVDASGYPHLVGVPEIVAAPLELRADPTLLRNTQHLASEKLLAQEALGISLPDREVMYCAWNFEPAQLTPSGDHPQHQHLVRAHAEIVARLTADLVRFGRPEARDLLLRASTTASFNDFARVRTASVLRGPTEGLRLLQKVRTQLANAGTGTDAGAMVHHYKVEFLRNQLLAQSEALEMQRAGSPSSAEQSDLERAALVFARWNDSEPLGDDIDAVLHTARNHPIQEVALLAEQLLVLESSRCGTWLPEQLTPRPQSPHISEAPAKLRRNRISILALNSPSELHDQLVAAAVAEGIIALLSATHLPTMQSLEQTVQHLPGTPFHKLWVRYLSATAIAIAAGDTARASREWQGFEQRLPRFLPIRLQGVIALIGAELRDPTATPSEQRKPTHHLLDYLRGALDVVRLPEQLPRDANAKTYGSNTLPVFRLMAAHLGALETRNPAALVRAAERLHDHDLWAPAVYALQAARAIFVRRRATGSVSRCDSMMRDIEEVARQHAPWFSAAALSPAPRGHLTKREIDVARLGAAGFSNREMAARLACSVRTVESHLASARAKLGAADRSELGSRLQDLGYLPD